MHARLWKIMLIMFALNPSYALASAANNPAPAAASSTITSTPQPEIKNNVSNLTPESQPAIRPPFRLPASPKAAAVAPTVLPVKPTSQQAKTSTAPIATPIITPAPALAPLVPIAPAKPSPAPVITKPLPAPIVKLAPSKVAETPAAPKNAAAASSPSQAVQGNAAPRATTINGVTQKRDPQDPVQFVAAFYIALDQAESFTSIGRMAKLQNFFDSELGPLLLKDDVIRDANEEGTICGFMNVDAFDLNRKNRTDLNHYELVPNENPPLVSVAFLDNEGAAVFIQVKPEKGLLKIHDIYYDDPDSKIGKRKNLVDMLRKAQSQHCVKSAPAPQPSETDKSAAPGEQPEAE